MRAIIFLAFIALTSLVAATPMVKIGKRDRNPPPPDRSLHQVTRTQIVDRQRDRANLALVKADAAKRKGRALAARAAAPSCSPSPVCGTAYNPTVNSYAVSALRPKHPGLWLSVTALPRVRPVRC